METGGFHIGSPSFSLFIKKDKKITCKQLKKQILTKHTQCLHFN